MKNYWLDKKADKQAEVLSSFDPCFTLENFPAIIGGMYNYPVGTVMTEIPDIKFEIPQIPNIDIAWEIPTEIKLDVNVNLPPITFGCIDVGHITPEIPFEGIPMSGFVIQNDKLVKVATGEAIGDVITVDNTVFPPWSTENYNGNLFDEAVPPAITVDWGTPPEINVTVTVVCPSQNYIQEGN